MYKDLTVVKITVITSFGFHQKCDRKLDYLREDDEPLVKNQGDWKTVNF